MPIGPLRVCGRQRLRNGMRRRRRLVVGVVGGVGLVRVVGGFRCEFVGRVVNGSVGRPVGRRLGGDVLRVGFGNGPVVPVRWGSQHRLHR
jgi:hypothetical protein